MDALDFSCEQQGGKTGTSDWRPLNIATPHPIR
jgi:hypothetical protein